MSFVHLHNHSHYSLLDSTSKIKPMLSRAVELGMEALAITDHGNLFGALEFYTEAQKAGIKPIIGMEAYVAPQIRNYKKPIANELHSYSLTVLAKNKAGFHNLIKLSSSAFLEGYYYKPRIDIPLLKKHSAGLVVLSGGLNGIIPYKIKQGKYDEAKKYAAEFIDIFGDDFYLEIQDHSIPEEKFIYSKVYELGGHLGVKCVATNNNHYIHKGDHQAHDILLCLQTAKDINDPNRLRYGTDEFYIKTGDEMYQRFKDKPELLENTMDIAEKCNLEIDYPGSFLSNIHIVNDNDLDADINGRNDSNNAAGIISFKKLTAEKAIRDVSRVLKIPIQQADAIAGLVPTEDGKYIPLKRAFAEVPELREIAENEDFKLKELVKYSTALEGVNRSIYREASRSIPVSDDMPLFKNNDGEIVIQWALEWLQM